MSVSFSSKINVGVEKYSYDLTFGYDEKAVEGGYNRETDKFAPPAPPGTYFDSALGVNGERYYSKIVKETNDEIIFSIFIQMGDNKKISFKWDKSKLSPLKSCIIQDPYEGRLGINVDMLTQDSFEITDSILNVVRLKIQKK